ncbi:RHS repeat domain-containing protein [Acinetobacter thutiue]|uniref:RHS repeat domain-containing protein n=1 Tax=Acinetobacter thutiue TaxID=2998078 RepID=UPI003D9C61A5
MFHNYFRDYDPVTGRYVESDPIGLDGGLNTYGYVGGSPLLNYDSLGLFVDTTGAFTKGASAVIQQGARVGIMCAAPAVAVGVGLLGVSTSAGSCETAPIECPDNGGKDPCKGLRNILRIHEEKLREYISNPDKYDNKGFLKNAPNQEVRRRIIDGRIKHLLQEIKTFKEQLEECERLHGKRG